VIDPNRTDVQRRLEALGFSVEPIAEVADARRPDLVARADGTTMYVEVKTRSEDRVLRAHMESVRPGETAEILTGLDKHNSLSAEIKHASSQLEAAASPGDMRLLWYRADSGPFVHDTKEQIGSTLYGMRMVLAESSTHELRPWHCAYAGHADFHRFQELDGVMVEQDGGITLFLNPFSPRRLVFASSRIARVVQGSVFDIEVAIAQQVLFAADGDAPRRSDPELLVHLAAKYPGVTFSQFLEHVGGTIMTTIDGSEQRPE